MILGQKNKAVRVVTSDKLTPMCVPHTDPVSTQLEIQPA